MNAYRLTLIIIVIATIAVMVMYFTDSSKSSDTSINNNNSNNTVNLDTTQHICTSEECSLLPVTDPAFNLRETAKQMLLLEDHLANSGKQCSQCIKKHCLTIEGYLEEALCLDCDNKYSFEINDLLQQFKKVESDFLKGVSVSKLSQQLRGIRKKIHVKYFHIGL